MLVFTVTTRGVSISILYLVKDIAALIESIQMLIVYVNKIVVGCIHISVEVYLYHFRNIFWTMTVVTVKCKSTLLLKITLAVICSEYVPKHVNMSSYYLTLSHDRILSRNVHVEFTNSVVNMSTFELCANIYLNYALLKLSATFALTLLDSGLHLFISIINHSKHEF